MTNQLDTGAWIRTKVMVSDSGDFNDRHAPAGTLGRVVGVDGTGGEASHSIVFPPSLIQNFWSSAEIAADAEVLPEGHPDIPSAAAIDLASAVGDITAEGEIDDDEGNVTAPAEVVARIVAAAGTAGPNEAAIRKLMMESIGPGEVTLCFSEFDELAGMVGVGDRLGARSPFPAP